MPDDSVDQSTWAYAKKLRDGTSLHLAKSGRSEGSRCETSFSPRWARVQKRLAS